MLAVGRKAPDFELPDANMELVRLSAHRGRHHVVLFFYAHDRTPNCTREAIDFSDHETEFAQHGAVVLGVSQDDVLAHAEFCAENGLNDQFLSDYEGSVCRLYKVAKDRPQVGLKGQDGVVRVSYVIDKAGVIRHIVPLEGTAHAHVMKILELVKELNNECTKK